jgi:hypothetical protein
MQIKNPYIGTVQTSTWRHIILPDSYQSARLDSIPTSYFFEPHHDPYSVVVYIPQYWYYFIFNFTAGLGTHLLNVDSHDVNDLSDLGLGLSADTAIHCCFGSTGRETGG